MKCQNCGNELGQDEVFCGQCGAPNAATAQPTEAMQIPLSGSGLPGEDFRTQNSAFQSNYAASPLSPEQTALPHQSAIRQEPQQVGGFYQDATEAVSIIPGTPANFSPTTYPQQGFNNGTMPGGYQGSGQFGTQAQQPFLTGNYSRPGFPPGQSSFSNPQFGQGGYSAVSGAGLPMQGKGNNAVMVVGFVCLIFAIITVGVFGALFALHTGTNQNQATPPVTHTNPSPTPTPAPSPTDTPTPTPPPSPTAVPTPPPDPNFSWCPSCAQSGYMFEFPNGWNQGTTADGQGTQFTDPSQGDIFAAVKTPSGGSSASDLLNAAISEFSSQPGYTPPQPAQSATIGATNWDYQTITYQANGQTEQVNIYATIYQGKGFVIELQAQQVQFSTIYPQFFAPMLTRFQFVTPGP